jgi:hypothetical protein
MLDRPRRDERSMDLFPVLVKLLFCEIRPSLDEAEDEDIAAGWHGEWLG